MTRFGFQTHVHGHAPDRELLPALVDLYVAAEELGFASGWVAQHHLGNDTGRLPSPLVLLAAAAEATSTIRLGTSIVVLPLEHPVRVAEDAAVLDALSGGRLELGIGVGGPSVPEFAAFGRDPDQRRELYAQHRERLLDLLGGSPQPGGAVLSPSAPDLLGRLWESPSSPERAEQVARAGQGLLVGIGPADVQRRLADAYQAAGGQRVAAFRGAFPGLTPGATRQSQAELLWPDVERLLDNPAAREAFAEPPGPHELLAALTVHYGTADDVIASVQRDPLLDLADDFLFAVQAASTSIDDAIRTLEVLAREVVPVLEATRPAAQEAHHG